MYYTSNTRIDFSSALVDKEFTQPGDYLLYESGDREIEIKLDSNKNHAIRLKPKTYILADFKKFYVSGSAGAEVNLLVIGSSDKSVRVIPGSDYEVISKVLIDESSYYDTLNEKNQFSVGVLNYATVSLFAAVEITNPTGSGKNVILHGLKIHVTDDGYAELLYNLAPVITGTNVTPVNNVLSEGIGTTIITRGYVAARFGQKVADPFFIAAGVASEPLKKPIILKPGVSFSVYRVAENQVLSTIMQYKEEDI